MCIITEIKYLCRHSTTFIKACYKEDVEEHINFSIPPDSLLAIAIRAHFPICRLGKAVFNGKKKQEVCEKCRDNKFKRLCRDGGKGIHNSGGERVGGRERERMKRVRREREKRKERKVENAYDILQQAVEGGDGLVERALVAMEGDEWWKGVFEDVTEGSADWMIDEFCGNATEDGTYKAIWRDGR